jgi:ribonuclease PH
VPILSRSLICSAINAVCMALMDAGIMTTDMVTSCSAGVLRHGTCQDLNQVCLLPLVACRYRKPLINITNLIFTCTFYVIIDDQTEQNSGGAYLPVAIKSRSEEIVYLHLDSRLSVERLEEAMAAAIDGCKKIRAIMQDAMKTHMTVAFERNKKASV